MKGTVISLLLLSSFLAGCSPLTLKPGDFAWPIESAIKVDDKGMVQDERYSISLNVKGLLFEETQDSVNVADVILRVIRDTKGYYFITASKFKNVYVFEQTEGGLKLVRKILVAQNGLNMPAFNQRVTHIQLVSEGNLSVQLTKDGISEGGKE